MKRAALFLLVACTRNEPPPRSAVHWTDSKGNPERDNSRTTESIRFRESQRRAATPQEPYQPRLRCNDGTTAVNCSPGGTQKDCCAGQGGVWHDAWGNVVYE